MCQLADDSLLFAGFPAANPRESRVRLQNQWVEVRRDDAEGSQRLIVSLGRGCYTPSLCAL